MRSMADADYVYKPWSAERRKQASETSRLIRGIPKGYRVLYGVNVPERQHAEILPLAAYVRKLTDDIEIVRTLIRALVRQRPLIQPDERKRLRQALAILELRDLSAAERSKKHPPQSSSESGGCQTRR